MKIRVFQIDHDKDEKHLAFRDYRTAMEKAGRIDESIYKQVYGGEVPCRTLEEVYALCNGDKHPAGYIAESMSVSNVVEIEQGNNHCCFYVDSIGFKPVEFDIDKADRSDMMRIVVCENEKVPYEVEIPHDIHAIRYVVPANQTATLTADATVDVTFENVLKKFTVSVVKQDIENDTAQGDASLAGAVYGIYNGDELIDTYTTDEYGSFTTHEFECGDNWTIKELTPSEGYLLDSTVYEVGAEANTQLYTTFRNGQYKYLAEYALAGSAFFIGGSEDMFRKLKAKLTDEYRAYSDKGRMSSKMDNLKAAYSAVYQDMKQPARTREQSVQTAKLLYELADCAVRCEVEQSMQTVREEPVQTEECSENMSFGYG